MPTQTGYLWAFHLSYVPAFLIVRTGIEVSSARQYLIHHPIHLLAANIFTASSLLLLKLRLFILISHGLIHCYFSSVGRIFSPCQRWTLIGMSSLLDCHISDPYLPNSEPKFSRFTPYQEESRLPEPVFGLGHRRDFKGPTFHLGRPDERDEGKNHHSLIWNLENVIIRLSLLWGRHLFFMLTYFESAERVV